MIQVVNAANLVLVTLFQIVAGSSNLLTQAGSIPRAARPEFPSIEFFSIPASVVMENEQRCLCSFLYSPRNFGRAPTITILDSNLSCRALQQYNSTTLHSHGDVTVFAEGTFLHEVNFCGQLFAD